jgi:ATP-dependent helicase HrpA
LETLQRELHRASGILVPITAFDLDKLPAHLRVTFAVEGADGSELARGKDLAALQTRLAGQTRRAVVDAVGTIERTGLRGWPDGLAEIPRSIESGGVRGYPGLVAVGTAVDLRVFATVAERDATMRAGVRRLLRLCCPSPVKSLEKHLDPRRKLVLGSNPDGSLTALLEDCADAAVDVLTAAVWSRADFEATRKRVAGALTGTTADILGRAEKVLSALHEVNLALPVSPTPAQAEAVADIRRQLDGLVAPGFVAATGVAHLGDLARYLTAVSRRLERLSQAPVADRERMTRVHAVEDAYDELLRVLSPARAVVEDVRDIARLIQEFRVSLWAQQLGTARPVSEQRIYRAIDAVLER